MLNGLWVGTMALVLLLVGFGIGTTVHKKQKRDARGRYTR